MISEAEVLRIAHLARLRLAPNDVGLFQGQLARVLEHVAELDALDLSDDGILSRIHPEADLIGLSATTPEISTVIRLCGKLRRAFPRARLILGGIHPSLFHRELVQDGTADLVVRGLDQLPV